jgi:hypothetical protein
MFTACEPPALEPRQGEIDSDSYQNGKEGSLCNRCIMDKQLTPMLSLTLVEVQQKRVAKGHCSGTADERREFVGRCLSINL